MFAPKRKNLLPVYLAGLVAKKYTLAQAAASCGYTVVRMCQLKKQYERVGLAVLEHKNRGHVPPNKTPARVVEKILKLYQEPAYAGINFRYFRECLENYEHIKIGYTTLRNIFKAHGIASPESHKIKRPKTHRPRIRRANFGDMLQIDGTPFPWFERFGDMKKYCMVGAIDDATSKITALYITENECLYGYMELLRQTIARYGCPREIYSDRAAVFCVTPKNKKNLTQWEQLAGLHDKRTQWQRILSDLSINQILAWSPEAKGRIERLWSTLQKRLPTELYLAGADTVEKANAFLTRYVEKHNKLFGVVPMRSDSFFLPCAENLDDILSAQIPRRADSRGCISFHSYKFEVLAPRVRCRDLILHISERGIFARFPGEDKYYNVRLLHDYIYGGLSETMPQVLENIIFRYLYADAKSISA